MYIQGLQVKNMRCFSTTEFTLSLPQGEGDFPNANVILGTNGAGKTTLLKALAIGLISPALPNSGFVPMQLVRFGQSQSEIELKVTVPGTNNSRQVVSFIEQNHGRENLNHWQQSDWLEAVLDDHGEKFFLCAYNSERKVAQAEGMNDLKFSQRYSRIAGLFESRPHYLNPVHRLWDMAFKRKLLETVIALLNELLPNSLEIRFLPFNEKDIAQSQDRLEFYNGQRLAYAWEGIDVNYNSLSDGYRAYIGWIADLLSNLLDVSRDQESPLDIPGVVLVDEVDLHLHPEWQKTVVPTLATAFPKLQFIFTTHSPLVAASIPSERLLVMDTREDGSSYARRGETSLYGKMAHQVLQSDYFGLDSTRDERFEDDFQEMWEQASSGQNPEAALKLHKMLAAPESTA